MKKICIIIIVLIPILVSLLLFILKAFSDDFHSYPNTLKLLYTTLSISTYLIIMISAPLLLIQSYQSRKDKEKYWLIFWICSIIVLFLALFIGANIRNFYFEYFYFNFFGIFISLLAVLVTLTTIIVLTRKDEGMNNFIKINKLYIILIILLLFWVIINRVTQSVL